MIIDDVSFLLGLALGFLVAGIIGQMLNRISKARNAMGDPDKPMKVATANTPRSVMTSAAKASQTCLVWSFTLVLFVGVVIALLIAFLSL
jgi:hypothetical protein